MNDRIDALERLARLRESGALSEDEFAAQKALALESPEAAPLSRPPYVTGALLALAAVAGTAVYLAPRPQPRSAPPTAASRVQPATKLEITSPPVPKNPTIDMRAAFRATFGKSDFTPVAALPVGAHVAVIAVKQDEQIHANPGKIAVRYADQTESGFIDAHLPNVLEQTGSFGSIGDWKVRRDLGPNPIVAVEGGGTWQGCSSGGVTLIELDPDQPRTIADFIPMYYGFEDIDPSGTYDGRLQVKNRVIEVVYTGAGAQTITLNRRKGSLVPSSPFPKGC